MNHLITLRDWTKEQIDEVIDLAVKIKKSPENFYDTMHRKVLVMIFEKPSLRTRVSFETGMCQMGGHAIYYDMANSPLGSGKETIHDTVKTLSRYSDLIMARLFAHKNIEEMARYADIPVINGLTDFNHPCQILSDLMTIKEKKGEVEGLTLAYLGDAKNNVTHSLLYGCSKMGININVGCPEGEDFSPLPVVMNDCRAICDRSGAVVKLTNDPFEAVKGADIIYTDSWMSYHVPSEKLENRVKALKPYQVDVKKMQLGTPDVIFMNCLPAMRGYEQTTEAIDGPNSVVFDQAENRLHCQKAIMVTLYQLNK
ncbi:MAG: ornithine carbamoyltransferase [Thermodesulfobacteriota bacterium]|nr:ornithine carbamoyltransferase [Thermodesulfobacteriota bacterium]